MGGGSKSGSEIDYLFRSNVEELSLFFRKIEYNFEHVSLLLINSTAAILAPTNWPVTHNLNPLHINICASIKHTANGCPKCTFVNHLPTALYRSCSLTPPATHPPISRAYIHCAKFMSLINCAFPGRQSTSQQHPLRRLDCGLVNLCKI